MTRFASRSGEKLRAALDAWKLDPTGWSCVDFGCNVGGFTDCLLQAGARKVFAIDTGYGQLAWTLRKDPRVVVMERTNALHCPPAEWVDLAAIDVAWTPQERILPAAMKWLKPGGLILSLLKPHYELSKLRRRKPHAPLEADDLAAVESRLQACLSGLDLELKGRIQSPIAGKGGNTEQLLHLQAKSR
jgi:23S rRNA (cytidine1920-2'-O)/16S rRNA (cytidine1409-2'-O)-methyltransferase